MRTHSPMTNKRGILVGRPLAGAMILAWLLALAGFAHLFNQNQELAHLVQTQRDQMAVQAGQIAGLQDRLRILEAIEDIQSNLSPNEEVHLAHQVFNYSMEHNLDPLLVVAVIRVESDFTPQAVSPMGALGLMQVMPATARWISDRNGWDWPGEQRLFEPAFNLRLATSYLSDLIEKFGRVEEALIAYNCGEGIFQLKRSTGEPVPRAYAKRVLSVYNSLQNRYGQPSSDCPDSSVL